MTMPGPNLASDKEFLAYLCLYLRPEGLAGLNIDHAQVIAKLAAIGAKLECLPPEGEPSFTLRAQDRFSPGLVQTWTVMLQAVRDQELNEVQGDTMGEIEDKKTAIRAKYANKLDRAFTVLREMRDYQKMHGSKTPD
jgi:hypothetical protein